MQSTEKHTNESPKRKSHRCCWIFHLTFHSPLHFCGDAKLRKAARLDTLILNQNSFGCEGVANLCEELSKCSAQKSSKNRQKSHLRNVEKQNGHFTLPQLPLHISPKDSPRQYWRCLGRCILMSDLISFVSSYSVPLWTTKICSRCTRLRVLELEGCGIKLERMLVVSQRFVSHSFHWFNHVFGDAKLC